MNRLDKKVALITGAAGGIGLEVARLFIREGSKVGLTDIREADGEEAARVLGDNALFVRHDVADPASWSAAVEAVNSAFGTVNVLVNNAGYDGPPVFLADMNDQDYLRTIAIDQHGTFFGMRAVIPGMIQAGGGSIVNVSSIAGFVHIQNIPNPAYTAAKFAVRGLTKAAAVEYGEKHIRVNSIHPGGVLTPLLEKTVTPEIAESIAAQIPLRRMAQPSEIAPLVLFLASDESSYITGSEHVIDGGVLAR